ncbi:hypothetical protein AALA90_18815 [Lachnospiraceae bacterium 38-10]
MYQEVIKAVNREDKEAVDILVREIIKAIKSKTINCDRTFKTAVRQVTPKGYIITDLAGSERTVKCAIPGLTLKPGQFVWVTMPCGKLKDMYVSGVVGT